MPKDFPPYENGKLLDAAQGIIDSTTQPVHADTATRGFMSLEPKNSLIWLSEQLSLNSWG